MIWKRLKEVAIVAATVILFGVVPLFVFGLGAREGNVPRAYGASAKSQMYVSTSVSMSALPLTSTFAPTITPTLTLTPTLTVTPTPTPTLTLTPTQTPVPTSTSVPIRYFVYCPLSTLSYGWPKLPGVGLHARAPRFCDGEWTKRWYAGEYAPLSSLWRWYPSSAGWKQVNLGKTGPYAYPAIGNPYDCAGSAFVATWGRGVGVWRSESEFTSTVQPAHDPYIYDLAVVGGHLFAATNESGIFSADIQVLSNDPHNARWEERDNGIDEKRIRSLQYSDGHLIAGARGCTLYVSDDEGDSWNKDQVLTGESCNDATVWGAAIAWGRQYAGMDQGKGLWSKGDGERWKQVKGIGDKSVRGVAYDANGGCLYVSTEDAVFYCEQDGCKEFGDLPRAEFREIGTGKRYLMVATVGRGIWYHPLAMCR